MTGSEVYEQAIGLMATPPDDAAVYKQFALSAINAALAESFSINNSMRLFLGKEELEGIPLLGALSEEIPYEEELVRSALPYGVCSKLYIDEDDMARVVYYHNLYIQFANACAKLVAGEVEDVYGGEGEA